MLYAEFDSLSEGEFLGIVDGIGGSAHVGFPGIAPGFAAAASALFAAKGAADLGAAGADVDVGDAAIGARGGQEKFGLAHVAGEDRTGKPLRDVVVDGDRLVQR